MADGASNHSIRRASKSAKDGHSAHLHGSHGPAAPAAAHGSGSGGHGHSHHHKDRPRLAFTGEEWGFGYQAADIFAAEGRERVIYDAGLAVAKARTEQEFRVYANRLEDGENAKFDFTQPVLQPLRTKEQALLAVKQHTADFAIVPFYHPYFGYDFESIRALGALVFLLGVEQIEATDNFCLAVHESQLYDLIQSAHPGTGFSALQRRFRKSWGTLDDAHAGANYDGEKPRAGLPIDGADQKLIRDRIDLVFAGPEASRRCKSKLDGLRAIGVEVRETPQLVEPHRELAKLARGSVNTARQTNTFFDPTTGETRFFSSLGAEAQGGKLFAMVLPYEVAMRSSDYVIIDHLFDDAAAQKTRFLVVEANPDHTLIEDAYRTTDQKTRYWYQRLSAAAKAIGSPETQAMRAGGAIGFVGGAVIALCGLAAAYPTIAGPFGREASSWIAPGFGMGAIAAGALVAALSVLFLQAQAGAKQGMRVMFRFLRNQSAASIGDVENFLRNHGVRYAIVRTDEDSEGHEPAPIVLDVEFEPGDFGFNPFTIFSKRLQNSVVNGALKKSFQRWKNRGVTVIAAMPIFDGAYQMPKPAKRRWWAEAVTAWAADFTETMFIRISRILAIYVLPLGLLALLAYMAWKAATGQP